jgi:internalin A
MPLIYDPLMNKISRAREAKLSRLDLSLKPGTPSYERIRTLPKELFELTHLESLSLRGQPLESLPSDIASLSNLKSLDLYGVGLKSLPEAMCELVNLRSLELGRNKLDVLPHWIGNLVQLRSLNLSSNRIAVLPDSLGLLPKLIQLLLNNNEIAVMPDGIERLQQLETFDVRRNRLAEFPHAIRYFHNLKTLDVTANGIKEIPHWLIKHGTLRQLSIGGNPVEAIPEWLNACRLLEFPLWIGKLKRLTFLDLSSNSIELLPPEVLQLSELVKLDMRNNNLAAFPEPITQLSRLVWLSLDGNRLSSIPPSIKRLQQLKVLTLAGNEFADIPEAIYELPHLRELSFANPHRSVTNTIKQLSPKISTLKQLQRLDLRNNPLETPPIEIASKGVEAIKQYFAQLDLSGSDSLFEAKLLIVGEAGAGKTTLARKLLNPAYELRETEKSTEGIEVHEWTFPADKQTRAFRANIWDFGGQEIYHATHQFFLTKRSLYILVSDARKEDTDFYYWLNIVELLSDGSPLVILNNEKQGRHREINESQLRAQFTNFEGVLPVDLAKAADVTTAIRLIQRRIQALPHIGTALPKTWIKVREALEADPRSYLPLDEYVDICDRNGFGSLSDKLQLSGYLHDLGVCLHFQEDPLLRRTLILKPKWGTDAVYRVLDNDRVIRNLGRFTIQDLVAIWTEVEYATMHAELLQLMVNFKLCYRIPGATDQYSAPQLLSEQQPYYEWNDEPFLQLRLKFDFMPKGILAQFIVATNMLIENQRIVWRSGVVLQSPNARAEIIEYYGKREIRVRISGHERRGLMAIVLHHFEVILATFNRLKYNILIPCNCVKCSAGTDPHYFHYDDLLRFKSDGQPIQCTKSYKLVDVRGLIDDVLSEATDDDTDERDSTSDLQQPTPESSTNTPMSPAPTYNIYGNIETFNAGQVNQPSTEEGRSKSRTPSNAWLSGTFYLALVLVIGTAVAALATYLPWYVAVATLIISPLIVFGVGILQLKNDEKLADAPFTELLLQVLKSLPGIRRLLVRLLHE